MCPRALMGEERGGLGGARYGAASGQTYTPPKGGSVCLEPLCCDSPRVLSLKK